MGPEGVMRPDQMVRWRNVHNGASGSAVSDARATEHISDDVN